MLPKTRLSAVTTLALLLALPSCSPPRDTSDASAADVGADSTQPSSDADISPDEGPSASTPTGPLAEHCGEFIGAPRIEELAPGLFVAIGFDLANTILIQTSDGNIVIDVSMTPGRAEAVKAALDDVAPGPVRAIVYTHSHIDHVGGAKVWVEEGTEIWATDAFIGHFVKQYGAFAAAESARANRQFGVHVSDDALPCSAIGRRADVEAAANTGARVPTHTFSGSHTLVVGDVELELVEAHGETHDQLFVWWPARQALMPGDNFYAAFPNLYTIRGTAARPVDLWVDSLDAMRRRDPAILVPSHTTPLVGVESIRPALRDYRDAIQWVQDEVVRGANERLSVDALAARVRLPEHLAVSPFLQERYGQVDWSVRALYTNALGWFDGRTEQLYPPTDIAAREVEAMGGADVVFDKATEALESGEARWATHLLGKLRDAGVTPSGGGLADARAAALRAVAEEVGNTNGLGWLLEVAWELEGGVSVVDPPSPDVELVDGLPVDVFFDVMASRLILEAAADVETTMRVILTDIDRAWTLTVRRGLVEVVEGEPLPDTPAPAVTVTTTAVTWRRLLLGLTDALTAISSGDLEADDLAALLEFTALFDTGLY